MKGKYRTFSIITLVSLILDQVTKIWIDKNFHLYQSEVILDGFFNLTYIRNPGAAFGFLADVGSVWVQVFFICTALFAMVIIMIIVKGLDDTDTISISSFALIFGGALGNFIDRITRGEVVDFLDVYWENHHWPAFNVADSAITIGVSLFIIGQLNLWRTEKQNQGVSE